MPAVCKTPRRVFVPSAARNRRRRPIGQKPVVGTSILYDTTQNWCAVAGMLVDDEGASGVWFGKKTTVRGCPLEERNDIFGGWLTQYKLCNLHNLWKLEPNYEFLWLKMQVFTLKTGSSWLRWGQQNNNKCGFLIFIIEWRIIQELQGIWRIVISFSNGI